MIKIIRVNTWKKLIFVERKLIANNIKQYNKILCDL